MLSCLIYHNLKTQGAIILTQGALHSVITDLNFDIRRVHFYAILTEIYSSVQT
jgi:hypothetical protein